MKKSILTIGTILAFTAGSTLFTSCGSNTQHEDESTEQNDMDGEQSDTMAEATHVCPMHPEITGLEGDTCSKCGMDLVASADTDGAMKMTHACPMHPEITGLEGDTCSKCGMDLTLAEASEEEHQH